MDIEGFIKKYRTEVLAKAPYRMNLVELLHANENAHTRILVRLLHYNHNDQNYEFAKSFVRKFIPDLDGLGMPEVWEQIEYIDALIGVSGKYAIVIENKINWAKDQDEQIQRYLEAAGHLLKVKSDKLYVIYLTDNGAKKPTENSLTASAKEKLGIDSNGNGRLLPLNYRDDIIPWMVEGCREGLVVRRLIGTYDERKITCTITYVWGSSIMVVVRICPRVRRGISVRSTRRWRSSSGISVLKRRHGALRT